MGVFLLDDPVVAVLGEDLALPMALTSEGDLATIEGIPCLEQSVEIRAFTRPDELAHKPNDGIDWDEYSNSPNGDAEMFSLRGRLYEQYAQREDRLDSVTVDVGSDPSTPTDTVCNVSGVAKTGDAINVPLPLSVS